MSAEVGEVLLIATQRIRIIAFDQQVQRVAQCEPVYLAEQRVAALLLLVLAARRVMFTRRKRSDLPFHPLALGAEFS